MAMAARAGRVWSASAVTLGTTVALAGWIVLSAAGRDAHPWPRVLLIAAMVSAFGVGMAAARAGRWLLAAAVAVALACAAVPHALDGGPLAPPLHYGNADGALYAVCVAAACALATSLTHRWAVALAALAALACGAATVATGSAAATGGALLVAAVAVLPAARRRPRAVAAGVLALMAAVLVLTVAAGATHRRAGSEPLPARLGASLLTERRVALWHDAVNLANYNPVRGVGAGRFPVTSLTAESDSDTRWAHSQPLEIAAESGLPALALLVAAIAGVVTIGVRRHSAAATTAVGIATVAATTLQAEIDYVAHFWPVMCLAALVVGACFAPSTPGKFIRMAEQDAVAHSHEMRDSVQAANYLGVDP